MEQRTPIDWSRLGALSVAMLLILLALGFHLRQSEAPKLLDYLSFWAAGQLVLQGAPLSAWSIDAHAAIMAGVTDDPGIMPFPYPPPFLFFILPFTWAPYALSFALWVAVTGGFYLWATRRLAPLAHRAGQPAVLINLLIGQNGFLTAGIFYAGVTRLAERPFLSGAILGTLLIKPQLALMLPVAVVAARLWPAIAGAALSSSSLLLAALIVFGAESYAAFLRLLPFYAQAMADSRFAWEEFASIFAFLRTLGAQPAAAMSAHLLVAVGVASLCWKAWAERWEQRVPVLCAATLLASPYLQAYDTLLLLGPFAWFLSRRPRAALALFLLAALQIVTQAGFAVLPNATPLAAVLALGLLWHEAKVTERPALTPALA